MANHSHTKRLIGAAAITTTALLASSAGAVTYNLSPTPVVPEGNVGWIGYMNVFEIDANGGGYLWGSSWGTADLPAAFTGNTLTIGANYIGDPASYWYTPSGGPGATGNKKMDANFYVEDNTLTGQTVTFTGEVLSSTLVAGYTSVAFIKDFAPDYSSFNIVTAPMTTMGVFSITLATTNDPARHVQFGFETIGACAWVTDAPSKGYVTVTSAPSVWSNTAGGDWGVSTNWQSELLPSAVDARVKFDSAITAASTVMLLDAKVAGSVTFNNTSAYTLGGAGSLALDVSSGAASLAVTSGSHAIGVPVTLNDDTSVSVAPGSTLSVTGAVSGAGKVVTKTGAGTLSMGSLNAGTLDVQAGSTNAGGAWTVKTLSVAAGAGVSVGAGASVVVDYDATSPLASVRAMAASGALSSSVAGQVVGYGEVSALPAGTAGSADSTSVYIRSTYAGDATLDGAVNFSDLLALAAHYNVAGTGTWTDGDFNSDSNVNFSDLLALAANYNKTVTGSFAGDWALAQSTVPEPATLAALALVTPMTLRRRR
ncbi:MAG: PEP-CTERM sorting domain-containing protein [Tepidisphaeraceae bacterium]